MEILRSICRSLTRGAETPPTDMTAMIPFLAVQQGQEKGKTKKRVLGAAEPLTVLRGFEREPRLVVREDLELDIVCSVSQELRRLRQRAVLHAGAVDGQDMVSHMQCTTSTEKRKKALYDQVCSLLGTVLLPSNWP